MRRNVQCIKELIAGSAPMMRGARAAAVQLVGIHARPACHDRSRAREDAHALLPLLLTQLTGAWDAQRVRDADDCHSSRSRSAASSGAEPAISSLWIDVRLMNLVRASQGHGRASST